MWGRWRDTLFELLSPTRCAGCERPGEVLCARCLEALTLIDSRHACTRCGAPFGELLCTECDAATAREAPAQQVVDRCLAMAVYEGPLPRVVRAYKDEGERRLAPVLAALLLDTAFHAETVAPDRYGGILTRADVLVFVPDTATAFRRRGFDHMEAIARPLAAASGRELVDALVKHGSRDQRALGRAGRAQAARGAYEVVADVTGARVTLVDDVITTGATMRAAAQALVDAGAAAVDVLALARVW